MGRRSNRIQIGKSKVRPEYLDHLKKAWREHRLVFFLGSGVSAPYGLSNWNDLVLDLLLNESKKFDQFWPHYRKALASWMTDYFDFSPLALARVVKYKLRKTAGKPTIANQQEFLNRVHESLYRNVNLTPGSPTALQKIAELAAKSEAAKGGRHIPAIFTLNFDDMLEQELQKQGVQTEVSYDAARRSDGKLPIIHVHGYLPQNGKIPQADLVFSEDEYHKISYLVFHWALADIINCLRNYTVLFIGLSMSDPNLRRLLDATQVPNQGLVHFLLRKDYEISNDARNRAIKFVDEYAREQAKEQKLQVKTKPNVSEAIDVMLKQAHEYDRELFKDMGVGTIWINDFADIPQLLEAIST